MGRLKAPLAPHHLHDDGNVVDGDTIEGLHHGLPTEPKLVELKPADPLGFRWRVPLSWVHNPSSVLALY